MGENPFAEHLLMFDSQKKKFSLSRRKEPLQAAQG